MIPRPEHPKPQFEREAWRNLNGEWRFAFDSEDSGEERGWPTDPRGLDGAIVVPFCPESRCSGVGHTDFLPAVWYHRRFAVPAEWEGMRVVLHFGAVDYECTVWVNGRRVGEHTGGSVSFALDITDALRAGENDLVVRARDDVRSDVQASGKQSTKLHSWGCYYTRVTGIWQTVWLEARPRVAIDSVQVVADLDGMRLVVAPRFSRVAGGVEFQATVLAEGSEVGRIREPMTNGVPLSIVLAESRPWSPGDPFLYDLRLELVEGDRVVDSVASYAGLRKFHVEENRFYLNNDAVFLRFVLDQGFHPEGVWTAPSDEELRGDIERAQRLGFNGARLHQKVFEERFHYWADRLGYLTWGEFPDWGNAASFANPQGVLNFRREWGDAVERDRNHPSIVAWTPFNETEWAARERPEIHRRALEDTVQLTRALDSTRPVNDSSGYVHACPDTDIYTVHDYEQDPEAFWSHYAELGPEKREGFHVNLPELSVPYAGQPYVVDEYGGTWWAEDQDKGEGGAGSNQTVSWGYGNAPRSKEEVYRRIEGLTKVLTNHPHIAGFCYTQLTDVEQEQNGLYTYDRRLKFDAERLRAVFGAPSAMESLGTSNDTHQ